MDNNSSKIYKLLVKASKDEKLKTSLIKNPREALEKEKISIPSKTIRCFENTKSEFHLIIPEKPLPANKEVNKMTKKASFIEMLRYVITMYHKNQSSRADIEKNCSEYLRKQGASIPKDFHIHVHLAKESQFFLVIPKSEKADEELSQFELEALAGGQTSGFLGLTPHELSMLGITDLPTNLPTPFSKVPQGNFNINLE